MIEIEKIDCFDAMENLKRYFISYEIDPYYFNIAKNRIFEYSII